MANQDLYWEMQQRKARGFQEAADAAKRELFPELSFSDYEPSITICRVCGGEGFHKPECKLRHYDGKDRPTIEDVMALADTEVPATKPLIEVERERLAKLNEKPVKAPKVEPQPTAPATEK